MEDIRGGSSGIISQITEITGTKDGVLIDKSAEIGDFVRIEGPCIVKLTREVNIQLFYVQ